MTQVTVMDFKASIEKYLALVEHEDIIITKNNKSIVKFSSIKTDKLKAMESLFGIIHRDGEDTDLKQFKSDRLAKKYDSIN